jgi:hypothetical protein
MLEEGVGDHCHEDVAVKPLPGSSLEVIKPKLFLELLMSLFADPARPDGAGERLDWCICWQVPPCALGRLHSADHRPSRAASAHAPVGPPSVVLIDGSTSVGRCATLS